MRKSTLAMLLGGIALTAAGASAAPARIHPGQPSKNPLSRMHKAMPATRWSDSATGGERQKRVSPHFTTPQSDTFEYLYGPDGSLWYAVCNFDTEEIQHEYYTEHIYKGFTFTIYDSNFNEIGSVRDKIELEEGEIRCAQIMLASQATKKFFNYDDAPEVMISFAMNTPDYVTNTRTKAYRVKPLADGELSESLATMPGYPVDAVNCAKDRWSEEFYITMLTEEQAGDPANYETYIDFLGDFKVVLGTYGRDNELIMERKIRQLDLPGDQMNSPMMLCKNVDGKLTLTYAQYEKSFFVDPSGMGEDERITEDNRLLIDVYQMKDSYTKEMELISSTKIETPQKSDDPSVYCTYYGIGTLMYDRDVDFGHYTDDGRPAFVVTTDDYLFSDDDHYNSSYYVYDADGKRLKTIAENTFDYVMMSDLPGYEPQTMFIIMGDDNIFRFVDLYSCKTVTEVDQMFREYPLSTSLDRALTTGGYAYASALSAGIALDDENIAAPVCWIDTNGDFLRLDKIPTGEGVELAQIYIGSEVLGPYVFNTDNDMEYMLLVKRRLPGATSLREELLIASPEKGVLHTFTEEEGKGMIRMVYIMPGDDPELILTYADNDDKFISDAYSLPFSKFAGGSGTADDPYLIATGGDLQQIKSAPGANYKLTADLDCSSLDFKTIDEFRGTLDGAGHTVSNLHLTSPAYGKTGIFTFCNEATVKDIDFHNATMTLSGGYEAGLIAATAARTNFENIHVRRLKASGDSYSGEFGGIAGKIWTLSKITGCEVAGADIDLPSCPSAGGITGDIRTGCSITACAFSGNMTANNTLGGIVGSTTTGDETISYCHVDANLKAENTIGGIVGFLDRSKVKSNYVEGTIEATKPSKWNNAVSLGAIAGELEGDWQGNADVPVVNNLIGVSALIAPDMSGIEEKFPRQLSTVHRVVGRSSYNTYFEEEPEKIIYENGILNNLVVSDIAPIDPEFDGKTLEGTTTDKNDIDQETLEKTLGFAFGKTSYAPWSAQAWYAYDPSLYFENILYMPVKEITVNKDATFSVGIEILTRDDMSADTLMDDFMCEFDESTLEMTGNMDFNGKQLTIEFKSIKEGESPIAVSLLNGKCSCMVKVTGGTAVAAIESPATALTYRDGTVCAQGCLIEIFDINGKKMAEGSDSVNASGLSSGVYAATATDRNGHRSGIKFVK